MGRGENCDCMFFIGGKLLRRMDIERLKVDDLRSSSVSAISIFCFCPFCWVNCLASVGVVRAFLDIYPKEKWSAFQSSDRPPVSFSLSPRFSFLPCLERRQNILSIPSHTLCLFEFLLHRKNVLSLLLLLRTVCDTLIFFFIKRKSLQDTGHVICAFE